MSRRRFFVGGNWKLNGSQGFIKDFCQSIQISENIITEIVLAPPTIYLALLKDHCHHRIQLASQNVSDQDGGAYTGETSVAMLEDLGIDWTLIGHSERRQLYGETNEIVSAKCKTVLDHSNTVKVILCIGETLDDRLGGHTWTVLGDQLAAAIGSVHVHGWSRVVVAYEPVWAIGTGRVASPEEAQEAHAWIRRWIGEQVSPEVADNLRIIYGGSVNGQNCAGLASLPDIDGFLVGGASLKPAEWTEIISINKY